MLITEAIATFKLPVLVYQYQDEQGYTFVTADILLLSGTCKKDLKITLDPKGVVVTLKQKWPETFLAWQRIQLEDAERSKRSPRSKGTALNNAATKVRNKCETGNDNRPMMTFQFKLPEPCKTIFAQKPFIATYQNDYKAQADENNNYLVLHLDFNALKVPAEGRSQVKSSRNVLPSPLEKRMDSDSDEDDDDDDGGHGTGTGTTRTGGAFPTTTTSTDMNF